MFQKELRTISDNYVPDAVDLLAVESDLAKQLDFNETIETFANKKALSALPSIDDLCVLYVYAHVLFF